jgi:hypothetical protein
VFRCVRELCSVELGELCSIEFGELCSVVLGNCVPLS